MTEHDRTVIHDPTQDQTILERWLRKQLAQGWAFWTPLLGALALVALVAAAVHWMGQGARNDAQAWTDLMLAQSIEDQIQLGRKASGPAAAWALLSAAEARYQEGFRDLPQNRATGDDVMKTSYGLFREALEKSDDDPLIAPIANLGMAKTLEARGQVDAAIEQYEKVASQWPDLPAGIQAAKRVAELNQPASRKFYERFASYTPPSTMIPPGGRSTFDLGIPGLDGSPLFPPGGDIPSLPDLPPALEGPAPATEPVILPTTGEPEPVPQPEAPTSGPTPTLMDPPTPPVDTGSGPQPIIPERPGL